MNTQCNKSFSAGDTVFLPTAVGEHRNRIEMYTKAFGGRGPFKVLAVCDAEDDSDHPQIVRLGHSDGTPMMVKYGSDPEEPLEVSGYWLTKEE